MRACLSLFLLSLASVCLGQSPTSADQSVADAARASQRQQRSAGTGRVITDDDIPDKRQTGMTEASSGDVGVQAEIDHLRTVYLKICADPEVQRSRRFSPEMKRELEAVAQPLRKRLQENQRNSNSLESQELSREEEAQVNAVAPKDGRALTLEERQKIGSIREGYAEKRRALSGQQSESTRQSLIVLSGVIDMISDCSKAGSLRH